MNQKTEILSLPSQQNLSLSEIVLYFKVSPGRIFVKQPREVAVDLVISVCLSVGPHEAGILTGYIFVKLLVPKFSLSDKFQLKIV